MPNHCYNNLTLIGKIHDLELFYNDNHPINEDDELCFENSVPIIDKEDGYNERIEKWGTKWEPWEIHVTKDYDSSESTQIESKLHYSFETAWSPPHEWFLTVAPKYSSIIFDNYYEDESLCFWGRKNYHNEEHFTVYEYVYEELNDYFTDEKSIEPSELLEYLFQNNYDITKIITKYKLIPHLIASHSNCNDDENQVTQENDNEDYDDGWETVDDNTSSTLEICEIHEENIDSDLYELIEEYEQNSQLFICHNGTVYLLRFLVQGMKEALQSFTLIQSLMKIPFAKKQLHLLKSSHLVCSELLVTPPITTVFPGGTLYLEAEERFNQSMLKNKTI